MHKGKTTFWKFILLNEGGGRECKQRNKTLINSDMWGVCDMPGALP